MRFCHFSPHPKRTLMFGMGRHFHLACALWSVCQSTCSCSIAGLEPSSDRIQQHHDPQSTSLAYSVLDAICQRLQSWWAVLYRVWRRFAGSSAGSGPVVLVGMATLDLCCHWNVPTEIHLTSGRLCHSCPACPLVCDLSHCIKLDAGESA